MANRAYTREEIDMLGNTMPTRGMFCSKCRNYIPEFEGLSSEQAERIKNLKFPEAVKELREITGCSLAWAKIWYHHPDGPNLEEVRETAPCPYCGKPLRTKQAKQCFHCFMDWHNPDRR